MSQITKRALEQSLKHLLLKKPLTKITINDITEDCGINRMTFYYHFKYIRFLRFAKPFLFCLAKNRKCQTVTLHLPLGNPPLYPPV